MNRNAKWMAITGAVLVAVVIVAVAIHAGRKHNTDSTMSTGKSSDTMNMPAGSSAHTPNSSAPAATDAVTIQDFAFAPANITVKVGDTVTWTNKDSTAHTVTADTASSDAPASSSIAPGGTYSFTFKKAATYIYHCSIHPSMQGSVTVTQ